MPRFDASSPSLQKSVQTWLLGFFGALFGFLLLPRALKFVARRFVLGVAGEIVAIVITGLLTEKAVDALSDNDEAPPPREPGARRAWQ